MAAITINQFWDVIYNRISVNYSVTIVVVTYNRCDLLCETLKDSLNNP